MYQCYHGDSFVAMTIVEWHPFERTVVQSSLPIPLRGSSLLIEINLEPIEGGTRFTQIFSKSSGPLLARIMSDMGIRTYARQGQQDIDNFAAHIEADAAALGGQTSGAPIAESSVADAARASLATQPG
jgi:hypothetical protein